MHSVLRADAARPKVPWDLWPFALCAAVLWVSLAPLALAEEPSPPVLDILLLEGDTKLPGGLLQDFGDIAVNNSGTYFAEVMDEEPDQDFNNLLLINGEVAVREGLPLAPGPVGADLDGFDAVAVNNAGVGGFNFFLDGVADDSGVYAYLDPSQSFDDGTVLVLQEGEDAPGFPAGTPVLGFFDVKINDNNDMLIMASIDAAAIPSTVDRSLIVLTPDPAGGVAASQVIASEGDVLPGQSTALTDFGTALQESAFNDQGDVIFVAEIPDGDAVYRFDGRLTELAKEGDPSPVVGRNWQTLGTSSVALNNCGSYAVLGQLDGDTSSNALLIRDGQKLVQEGDSLPSIAPFSLTQIFGPVLLNDGGEVLWYGQWNNSDTSQDTGLFLNDRLLVQEGVSLDSDGFPVLRLYPNDNGYAMSDNGVYVLVRGEQFLDGLFLITRNLFGDGFERGDTSAWCNAVP